MKLQRNLLFVCTGNSCRSQMAEAWARVLACDFLDYEVTVSSAGLEAHGLNPGAVAALARRGVDISAQQSKLLNERLVAAADVIITVCGHADANCPVIPPGRKKIHLPFDDPAKATGSDAQIQACFDRVCEEIRTGVADLLDKELPVINESGRQLGRGDYRIESRRRSHDGFVPVDVLGLRHRLFQGGWSETLRREVAVRPRAVGALLYDVRTDEVVLVRQFRAGLVDEAENPWILEVVAGLTAAGEAPVDVVKREAMEETNCPILDLIPICEYYNSPGWSNEKISLFCALVDASGAGGVHGLDEEHEDILVVTMPFDEALDMVKAGAVDNAMAIIAIQWMALNKQSVIQRWDSGARNR